MWEGPNMGNHSQIRKLSQAVNMGLQEYPRMSGTLPTLLRASAGFNLTKKDVPFEFGLSQSLILLILAISNTCLHPSEK